jgi:hypothetical protein
MKEYIPTPQDITELNLAAEKLTDEDLKSKPLCKLAKSTNFYKTVNKSNSPDCVDMALEGISQKGTALVDRIVVASEYSYKKTSKILNYSLKSTKSI